MTYAKILGTGGYLPEKVFTNKEWESRVDTSDEWIFERTGILSRHIAAEHETASFMGIKAAEAALEMANRAPKDVGMIIVATGSPDCIFPATACLIQKALGVPIVPAFDLQAACTGFIYGLSVANQFIQSGQVKSALVVGTEMMSRLIDWSDRNTCVLFGDGAGAVYLEQSEAPGILSTNIYADGNYAEYLKLENAQVGDHTSCVDSLEQTDNPSKDPELIYPFIQMKGRPVFKVAVTQLGEMVLDIQRKHGLSPDSIDWLVPHQANIRIIKATAEKLGLPMEKVICTVAHHSNTSSASIPLALDVAVRDGRIQRGQNLLFEAFGGGLTWGSCFVKF